MRKSYIDNIRTICVLILFPYHTFMIYNSFGEDFYVKGTDLPFTFPVIATIWPWIMPLMFLLAGISSAYSLKTRTLREYLKERVLRLLIPFISGLLLLVPIQTYFAEKFHNNYSGTYFAQYILFFTKPTDLSGYSGGFTPAHLWFILYLFLISLVSIPVFYLVAKRNSGKESKAGRMPLAVLLLFFIVPVFSQMILDISGKSFGEYLTYFLFGFFLISDETVQEKLQKHRFLLLGLSLPLICLYSLFGFRIEKYSLILYELLYAFYAWSFSLAVVGMGKQYLNYNNGLSRYLSAASFSVYTIHQQWIVVIGFFVLAGIRSIPLQIILIILLSIFLTLLTYEIFKRISLTRILFGIKKSSLKSIDVQSEDTTKLAEK